MIKNLFRLPWTEFDNPNGWIEPTTYCNLSCPGCYRSIDKLSHKPEHQPLEEVLRQIDWFVAHRNIHTLSISGGDPILYPDILEVVKYASNKKLRVLLYTNGLALNKKLLVALRDAGVTQFLLHIDRYQSRPDLNELTSVTELKQQFCDLFRTVEGTLLGFIQPLSSDHYQEDVVSTSNIARRNIDVVSLIVFTLYREVCWEKNVKETIATNLTIKEVVDTFKYHDGFIPAAYLPSTDSSSDPTWLFGARIAAPQKLLGYFSPRLYRLSHMKYRKKTGKYLFISRKNTLKINQLLKFFYIKPVMKIWLRSVLLRVTGKVSNQRTIWFQTILLLRGPEKKGAEWDLCAGCPDRIIFNNRLLPSCILEDLKNKDNSTYKSVELNDR